MRTLKVSHIGTGVLNVIISSLVLVAPLFGVILAAIMIGLTLLIVGIQMITSGVMGRRQQINSKTTFGP